MTHRYLIAARIKLAATLTAARCARMFVAHTLREWGLEHLRDTSELIVSELVSNSVRATGTTEENPPYPALENVALIAVQLRMSAHESLVLEVWDSSAGRPRVGSPDDDAEGGRGLLLVEAISDRWGVWESQDGGGKVVYAELGTERTRAPVRGGRPLPEQVRQAIRTGDRPQHVQADTALLRRLLEGLEKVL